MSTKQVVGWLSTASCVAVLSVGCAAAESVADESPSPDTDALGEQQLITSVNVDGTWTANAHAPEVVEYQGSTDAWATADFTGPAGYTRRMGVCLLKKTTTTCTTAANCSGISVPSGGFRYCTSPNGVGTKYCYLRMGPPTTYCAGTPALGGAPVAPGPQGTNPITVQPGTYISYGCFEGCAATDPSSSGMSVTVTNGDCGAPGQTKC